MFFFTRKAATAIILTIAFGFLILSSNSSSRSMQLLLSHPTAYAAQQQTNNNNLFITHGVASGDITEHSAIIWSRTNKQAQMHVEYDADLNFSQPKSAKTALANQTTDFTTHAKLEGLSPNTLYYYRVWFSSLSSSENKNRSVVSDAMIGSFRTPPDSLSLDDTDNPIISFIFAADLGGQLYCRQIDKGYSIFSKMKELSPDFFIANGDMIYAGDKCPADGPDGPSGWQNIPGNFSGIVDAEDKNRIYRSFNWGPYLDLLILDARSYRSPNSMTDTVENNKTLLGREQLQWLKQELLNSSATWKVISSDVPISVPTGANASILGQDAWANGNETNFSKTGFERELQGLLKFLDDSDIKNIVFVTTDVHFPANIRYEVDANADGDKLIFHELISGPLSAFRFGVPGVPLPKLDTTFNPKLLYQEGGIFNFGYVQIQKKSEDNKVHLIAEVRGEDGLARPKSLLDLAPQ